ncbi:sensor domain-containing protein [Natronococcus sp.]|uniref:sensor domain-containing protein n=1 Tax=Natronococcus sp. TaxID=35747 RepID=UPI0025DD27A3|nr:sensor domain-containing protein [Natronococcus sp.]
MVSVARTRRAGRRAVGALVERQTYKNLLYLFLAIPLGFLYYFTFGFGVLLGLLLTLVLVGVAILFVTLLGARIAAGLERRLANVLLGLDLERYEDVADAPETRSRLRAYVDAPSTWRAVGFLSMKTLVSVVALLGVIALAWIVELLLAPLRYPTDAEFGELNGEPLVWSIETVPEVALAGALGAALLVVFVHVANAIAYVCGRMSAALLGEPAAGR